jgi:TetR/AcrR family transcriptional regulator
MSPRDGQPSREAVLAAAEDLFARKGYDLASLQQIGEAAGVSRGLPSYFFGSKEALYDAVIARVFARMQEALRPAWDRAAGESPAEIVADLIDGYLDFLAGDPNFVRIVQREALRSNGAEGDGTLGRPVLQEAFAGIKSIAEPLGVDPAHLLVILASVWFPYAHADTLLHAVGRDPYAPEFREQHRRDLVALLFGADGSLRYRRPVLHGFAGPSRGTGRRGRSSGARRSRWRRH